MSQTETSSRMRRTYVRFEKSSRNGTVPWPSWASTGTSASGSASGPCLAAVVSMSATTRSASSRRPCPTSQRGDSGSSNRSAIATRASRAPSPYIQRHPVSKPGPACANGSPLGHASAGVVRISPSQMPRSAPIADMMKMSDVNVARERRGATSPMNVLTIARSAPMPKPVITPETALDALKLPVLLNLVGYVVGTLFLSPLADRYGRRNMLMATMALTGLGSLYNALAPDYTHFVVAEGEEEPGPDDPDEEERQRPDVDPVQAG